MFMVEVEFMNMIVKLFLPVLGVVCYTSNFSTMAKGEDLNFSHKNIIEQTTIPSYSNVESHIDALLDNIENLQKNIDDIELDFNRELSLKLSDLFGFKNIIEKELENNDSMSAWISNKLKLYQINREIEEVENRIRDNNTTIETLNKEIDFINEEIIQINKDKFISEISEKYCNCD